MSNSITKLNIYDYKTAPRGSQYRFGVLAKIIKHMKTRHQQGQNYPLNLDEILNETNQLDVGNRIKQWLQNEALLNNPKIDVTIDGKFQFKSLYKLRNKKHLLKLLKQQDLKGLGGILLDDIQESLPYYEKVLKILQHQNDIIYITRPLDKKKILFYNDRTAILPIDEEFQKLWRMFIVNAMDDAKIEEYLNRQGIRSMQSHCINKSVVPQRKKLIGKQKSFKQPRDNKHLADVLENYIDSTFNEKN